MVDADIDTGHGMGTESVVSRNLLMTMREARLSATEIEVLLALMCNGVGHDGMIGLRIDGTPMTSAEVADYVGGMSAADVRRAVMGLRRKGVVTDCGTTLHDGARYAMRRMSASTAKSTLSLV